MKTACAFALVTLGCAHAFVMPGARTTVRPQTARPAEKINTIEFEKDSPKVCVVPSDLRCTELFPLWPCWSTDSGCLALPAGASYPLTVIRWVQSLLPGRTRNKHAGRLSKMHASEAR